MAKRCEVLLCPRPTTRKSRRDGWAFPPAVRALLLAECEGMTVLHLFGGKADFGVRMDIDPSTNPSVVADAWLPPFARDSFDVVIIDPPYVGALRSPNGSLVRSLLVAATWIARKRVVWLHTLWIESPARCKLERSWLVASRSAHVRALQFFTVPESSRKLLPVKRFTRGPAIKYNHWLKSNMLLPLKEQEA